MSDAVVDRFNILSFHSNSVSVYECWFFFIDVYRALLIEAGELHPKILLKLTMFWTDLCFNLKKKLNKKTKKNLRMALQSHKIYEMYFCEEDDRQKNEWWTAECGRIEEWICFLGLPDMQDVFFMAWHVWNFWILPLPAHTIPLAKEDGYHRESSLHHLSFLYIRLYKVVLYCFHRVSFYMKINFQTGEHPCRVFPPHGVGGIEFSNLFCHRSHW